MLHSLDLARSFQVDNAQSCIASEANDKTIEGAATFTRDKVAYQNSLAALPLVTYQAGQPHSVVAKTVSKMEGLLAVSGASLLYAGYPFDPFA